MTELDLQGSQQIRGKLRLKHNKGEYSPITMGGDEAWSPDEESGGGSTLDSPVWRRAGMQSTHHHHQQQQQQLQSNGKSVEKTVQIEWVMHLCKVAEGLMTKLHSLRQVLGPGYESGSLQYPDTFWKSGILPDLPKLCQHIARRFPEHPAKLQLEKVDKAGVDMLYENSGRYVATLEPWILVIEDLMTFREQVLRVIMDLGSTVVTLLPNQNPLLLSVFMDLFCGFIRVNLLADKVPCKMLLQTYNLTHTIMKSGRDYGAYHRMVQFLDSYDPPLRGLQDDLNFVSPRIGEILDAVGPTVRLGLDFQKLCSEGYLSPYHPRYPDKLINYAHPARSQDLVNLDTYREWVLLGYLVCPGELLRDRAVDIAMLTLKESLLLPVFRDEYIFLHDEYQQHVLPHIVELKKQAKAERSKARDADAEYHLAKSIEKQICEVHDTAISNADSIHCEHRLFLKRELGRMVLFLTDQPTLLPPNLQDFFSSKQASYIEHISDCICEGNHLTSCDYSKVLRKMLRKISVSLKLVFSVLAIVRSEILWYFCHVGIIFGKSKGTRFIPIEMDIADPSIGFLLEGMDRLICLVRKYAPAGRAFAIGYVAAAAQRMQQLLAGPGIVAMDIDTELHELFSSIFGALEQLPKLENDQVVPSSTDLSVFRRSWLQLIMLVSSSRSAINIQQLDMAIVSAEGNESIITEGNRAYLWSRAVDEMDKQILQHTSLKMLYFYRQQVTAVFRHTMVRLEGHPQHCCAWLSLACNFTDNAHPNVPDELPRFARDAVLYAESLLDSLMDGLEGLINILDSEGGYGSLDKKLLPEQAAMRLNHVAKTGVPATTSTNGNVEFPWPGFESEPLNREKIKMLEAAMQRLTSLCSVVNQMEPLRVLNHMFVPREYLRQRVVKDFREFLANVIIVDGGLQRLSVAEAQLQRHMSIVHLVEQHVQLDLTRGLREVFLTESFAHPMRNFQPEDREVGIGGEVVCTIADWYIENVFLTDATVCGGVLFSPLDKCFKSTRPIGQIAAESVTNLAELKAFVRIFGPYGVDKLCGSIQSQLKKILGLLQTSLHTNKETLGSLAAGNFSHTTQSRCRRDTRFLQVIELETVMANCLLVGHLLSMWSLLVEATGQVLQSNTPLLFSLFSDFTKHAPVSVPETPNLQKMKSVASQVGAVGRDGDAIMLQNILADMEGTASEQSWDLAPFLFVACMASKVWKSTNFNVYTGGFTTNVYCLSRCINGIIVASEWVRAERKELQKQGQLSEPCTKSSINRETAPRLSAGTQGDLEARIKSAFANFLQNSVAAVLEAWDDAHRSPLVAKLVFLDQLCQSTHYLPRSTLETYVPHTIMRSIYQMYYESSVPTLINPHPSTCQFTSSSPNNGIDITKNQGEPFGEGSENFTMQQQTASRGSIFSGPIKFSNHRRKSDVEPVKLSGSLEYTRRMSFTESHPNVATAGDYVVPTKRPLARFMSGPLLYLA